MILAKINIITIIKKVCIITFAVPFLDTFSLKKLPTLMWIEGLSF